MSEDAWRRKTYYRPRVLIETGDVLDCPFPDSLVCLTGAEQLLLRNLTQYLHRRSTFASEYHDGYYLAPTNEQWDDLDAIIADLEGKLMGCPEIQTMLEDILAAALCACEGAGKTYVDAITGPIYDNLEDDGVIAWVPEDGTPIPGIDDCCALAQLVWQMNYEILTEYLQPLQTAAHNILLFLVLEALAVMLGGPVALAPGAALYVALTKALDAWVEGELMNVETELLSKQFHLVCAMYEVWDAEGDYADAAAAAAAVIDDSEAWSAIDKALFKATFAPWVMSLCQTAWTAQSDWAVASATPGYCDLCQYGWFTQEYWETAPPCPGVMTLSGGAYCKDGYWTVCGSNDHHITTPIRRVLAGSYGFQGHYDLKSETPAGWGVGDMRALRSYNLEDWVQVYNRPVGFIGQNVWTEVWGASDPVTFTSDAYVYMYWTGQAGQSAYEKFYRGLGWKVTPT